MIGAQKGVHYVVNITSCYFDWQQELLLASTVSQSMLPLLLGQIFADKVCNPERNVAKSTACH